MGQSISALRTSHRLGRSLYSLTPREERVLRMRFGIGMNTDHTLEEVGQQFSVTRERIRQIEAKALRKLKHPSWSRKLRSFLDNCVGGLAGSTLGGCVFVGAPPGGLDVGVPRALWSMVIGNPAKVQAMTVVTLPAVDGAVEHGPGRLPRPSGHVGAFIRSLAAQHDVGYVETASDRQCADFARLSDSDVRLDETERLLTALYRRGAITRAERNDLHDAYIRHDLGLD